MSIKTWWNNLGQQPPRFDSADYHEKELNSVLITGSTDNWRKTYHEAQLNDAYRKEYEEMKKLLAHAYKERKTVSKWDVELQLDNFSKACEALAHQQLLGVSKDSEISKIVYNAWINERSKLMYLFFDDIGVPLEVVEQKIVDYKKEMQDDTTTPQ